MPRAHSPPKKLGKIRIIYVLSNPSRLHKNRLRLHPFFATIELASQVFLNTYAQRSNIQRYQQFMIEMNLEG